MRLRDDSDGWTLNGRNILAPARIDAIRACLERSPVIVEHWYYRGGRSPDRLIFDDFEEDFESYVREQARPGDAFHVWDFGALCRDENTVANGKYPDPEGYVPERGAY